MLRFIIENGDQIPASFGPLRTVRKKTLVQIREPEAPLEHFKKSWGDLIAIPGQDYVLLNGNDPQGYPCKIDIFEKTYEEAEPGTGYYRKRETSRIVQVAESTVVILKTKEGEIEVQYPDFIAVGPQNEVYANRLDWVSENLEFIERE